MYVCMYEYVCMYNVRTHGSDDMYVCMPAQTEMEVVVEHQVKGVVSLRNFVISSSVDRSPQLHTCHKFMMCTSN